MEIEYSSDDSLAWAKASSDSLSSTDVTPNVELNNCDSGSEYKTETHDSKRKKHKKKAKKRKRDEDLCENDDYDRPVKKKKIKSEPESDKDKNETEYNIAHSGSYVNLKIKQENSLEPDEIKSKKKKKHKKSKNESELLNDTDGNHVNDTLDVSPIAESRKKKKKKKSKHSDSEEGREKTKKDHSHTTENIEDNQNEQSDEIINDKGRKPMSSTFIENDLNKTNVDETLVNNISAIPSSVSKKTTRISDRFTFEDDENISKLDNGYESDNVISVSRNVKMFLDSNPTLSPLNSFIPFNTDDDDIWVLKCPTEINIGHFKGVNLVLDGKSKIKVSGQTYDGTIEETDCKLPIVTYSRQKVFLKNLSVLKTITFRKRIPVPHIQDDNVVMHNHTSFIPLPDTKYRHPLFGTNYKKAIKISKSVGERLAENDFQSVVVTEEVEQDIYKKQRKKHKKEKNRIEKEEVEAIVSVKEEDESQIKKRKRKHKIKEENDIKPAKRIKMEQNAWESEKAIEENLFNF